MGTQTVIADVVVRRGGDDLLALEADHPATHHSPTNLSGFTNGVLDWIYIDGDHFEAGVRRDANCAARKIKPDGFLVFNDDTLWSPTELIDYGVVPVANDLVSRGGWEVAYLALHPLVHCDVALRRRPGHQAAAAAWWRANSRSRILAPPSS